MYIGLRVSARYSKNCAVLGYDAASSGHFLTTFQDNLIAPSLGDNNPKERIPLISLLHPAF